MFFVYFAQSLKNKLIYVGYTSIDPKLRIKQHNSGSNIFTKRILPLKLIYYEQYVCKVDAINREKFYKSGFGKQIKQLIVKYLSLDRN